MVPKHIILTIRSITLEKSSGDSSVAFYLHDVSDEEEIKYPICFLNETNNRYHQVELTFYGNSVFKCSIVGNGTVSVIGTYTEAPVSSPFYPAFSLPDSDVSSESEESDSLSESQDSGN